MKVRIPLAAVSLLTVLLLLSACAAAGTGEQRTRQDLITREEIESIDVSNLYDVVQRLRPRWLNVRSSQSFGLGTDVVVYQGQALLGTADVLRQLGPREAHSLRYLDGATATASLPGLGSRHVAGAIVIQASPRDQ